MFRKIPYVTAELEVHTAAAMVRNTAIQPIIPACAAVTVSCLERRALVSKIKIIEGCRQGNINRNS